MGSVKGWSSAAGPRGAALAQLRWVRVHGDQRPCLSRATALCSHAGGCGGLPGRGETLLPTPPCSVCRSMEIKLPPRSHACLRLGKRRLATGGGTAGPHVPAEECGGAGPGRGGERRLGHGAPAAVRRCCRAAAPAARYRGRRHPPPGLRQLREHRGVRCGEAGAGGRCRAHPRVFACRSVGPSVSSGGAGLRARGSPARDSRVRRDGGALHSPPATESGRVAGTPPFPGLPGLSVPAVGETPAHGRPLSALFTRQPTAR